MSGNSSSPLILGGVRNSIIGGDFSTNPWQRGVGSFTVISGGYYTADRWKVARGGGATGLTVGRGSLSVGDVPGTLHFLRAQRDSGNSSTATLVVSQSILTADSRALNQRSITLSFWARAGNDFTGTYSASIYFGQGTDEDVLPGFTSGTNVSMNVGLTPAWQKFTLTCAAGGFSQAAVYFQQSPSGTASTNDYADLALIQLAPTMPGSPFLFRSVAEEVALCQQFYVSRPGNNYFCMLPISPTAFGGYISFPQRMIAQPTVDIYNSTTLDQVATLPSGTISGATAFLRTQYGFGQINVSSTSGLTAALFNYSADTEL